MSDRFARRQLVLSSGLTLVVVAGVGFNSWLHGSMDLSRILGLAFVIVIAGVMYARNYTQAVAFMANHTLILTSDALLIRDGAIERKIPFDAIELLKARRQYFGEANFTLKVAGAGVEVFHGYENADALISGFARRLPRDRILDMRNHA